MFISIANRKGGVGKTTIAFHLIHLLKEKGKVLAVDLDSQANLSVLFTDKLGDVEELLLSNQIKPQSVDHSIDLLAGSHELDFIQYERSDLKRISRALEEVKSIYDYVVVDTPPELSVPVLASLKSSDLIIVPVSASFFSLQFVGYIRDQLLSEKEEIVIKLIINCYRNINAVKEIEEEVRQSSLSYEIIPNRVLFERALREKKPIWELRVPKRDRGLTEEIRGKLSSLIEVRGG